MIPGSNCRPTRCSQNVSGVSVVTGTMCELHSFLLMQRARTSPRTIPDTCVDPLPLLPSLSARTFTEIMRTFMPISCIFTHPFIAFNTSAEKDPKICTLPFLGSGSHVGNCIVLLFQEGLADSYRQALYPRLNHTWPFHDTLLLASGVYLGSLHDCF